MVPGLAPNVGGSVGLVTVSTLDGTMKPHVNVAVTITFPAELASGVTVTLGGTVLLLEPYAQLVEGKVQAYEAT